MCQCTLTCLSRSCGLCGNANGNKADDFENPLEGNVADCTKHRTARAKRVCKSLSVGETWTVDSEKNMPG